MYSYGQEAYFENEERRRVASEPRVSERPVEPQNHQFSGRPSSTVAAASGAPPAPLTQNRSTRNQPRGRQVEVEENTISLPLSRNILTALAAMDMEVAPPPAERRLANFANIANLYSLLNPNVTPFMEFTFNNRTFMEPIQVHPTPAQIQVATRVGNPATPGESCAICQDSMNENQNCRQILQCEHWFHQDCIDPWFQQNVRCPVCRFDIRDHGSHRRSQNASVDIPAQPPAAEDEQEGVN